MAATPPEKNPLILLAEDDVTLSNMFYTYLTEEGFDVVKATDGEEALNLISETKPSIILLDLMMPKVSGYDVLAAVKKDAVLSKIPVLVFSNLGQQEDVKKAQELGAQDYLIKAELTPDQVVEKIKKYLKG